MNESTRKKIVYATAAAAVAWALYNLPGGTGETIVIEPAAAVKARKAPTGIADKESSISVDRYRQLNWGRDPFRPWPQPPEQGDPTARQFTDSPWNLGGILYKDSNPFAYINGRSVCVGDTVAGAKIVAIKRKSVTLTHQRNQVTISVNKGLS
ncbi:MAG: hypothetical protein JSU65_01110 [Candidatus Zixiibacteriota bacterium]|nr:MAG: hypothetical protein JSU65_01110 [candidate division Zixibacteria bacterium]